MYTYIIESLQLHTLILLRKPLTNNETENVKIELCDKDKASSNSQPSRSSNEQSGSNQIVEDTQQGSYSYIYCMYKYIRS